MDVQIKNEDHSGEYLVLRKIKAITDQTNNKFSDLVNEINV